MERCGNCGGEPKISAATLEQPVIEKILTSAYCMPNPAQAYLWFSLGLAFADWRKEPEVLDRG